MRSSLKTRVAQPPITQCIFCGSTDLTEEHLVADWVVRAFLRSKKARADLSGTFLGPSELRLSTSQPIATARILCRRCNNEWVSRIDNYAARALRPLIQGRTDVALDQNAQAAVAAWVFKSALVFDASTGGQDGKLAALAAPFATERQAPLGCTIWVGPAPQAPFHVEGIPEIAGLAMFGVRRIAGQINLTINVKNPDGSVLPGSPRPIPTPGWAVMLGRMQAIVSGRRGPIIPTPEWRYSRVWPTSEAPMTLTSVPPERPPRTGAAA
jgi:hypothetical protein